MKQNRFTLRPILVDCLRTYSLANLKQDVIAGLIVGVVCLPLAMALGIASGVTPEAGLYSAIVSGLVIALLGGCRFQVSGPTAAFVGILYGVVAQYGADKLPLCTLLAGILILLGSLSGLGNLIRYIPYPVTMGFTTGIAVVLIIGQIKDFCGLQIVKMPSDALEQLQAYYSIFKGMDLGSLCTIISPLLVGVFSLILLFFWPKKWSLVLPPSLLALVIPGVLVALFGLKAQCIIDKFPAGIPQGLPKFTPLLWTWEDVQLLITPAIAIAMLGSIESLLCAVVSDGLTDTKHNSTQEIFAQGIGNIVGPLFGAMPATGAVARTAINIRSGAATPIASVVHCVTLVGIMLLAAPLVSRVPLAALSAVLIMVGINMGQWHEFKRFRQMPRSDYIVFVFVCALTVCFDLVVAIEIGLLLALLLFVRRISLTSNILQAPEALPINRGHTLPLPPAVQVFRMQGALFFGTADRLETALKRSLEDTRVLILIMDQVIDIDASGLNALDSLRERLYKKEQHLILCSVHMSPMKELIRSGMIKAIGKMNIVRNFEHAVQRAHTLLIPTPTHTALAERGIR